MTITLTGTDDRGNAIIKTVVTDATGHYLITDLPPSNANGYNIAETQPAGWLDGLDTSSKNGIITNDLVSGVVIAAGDKKETGNFGEIMPASIGDFVWNDVNGNGIQDAGEAGIPGVVIVLTGTDDLGAPVELVTTTDANGKYIFAGLRPGTYKLTMSKAGLKPTYVSMGTDTAKDSDFVEKCSCVTVVLKGNKTPTDTSANRTDIDGGLYLPGTITGTAPPGVVVVTPKDPNDKSGPITVTVGPDGIYVVNGLRPGTYEVKAGSAAPATVVLISGNASTATNFPKKLANTGANTRRNVLLGSGLVLFGLLMLALPKAPLLIKRRRAIR